MGRRIGKTVKKASTSRAKSQLTNAKTLTKARPETRRPEAEVLAEQESARTADRDKHNQRRAQFGE